MKKDTLAAMCRHEKSFSIYSDNGMGWYFVYPMVLQYALNMNKIRIQLNRRIYKNKINVFYLTPPPQKNFNQSSYERQIAWNPYDANNTL